MRVPPPCLVHPVFSASLGPDIEEGKLTAATAVSSEPGSMYSLAGVRQKQLWSPLSPASGDSGSSRWRREGGREDS